jgi:hypothetical protein
LIPNTISTNVGTFGFGFHPISIPKVQNIKFSMWKIQTFIPKETNIYYKGLTMLKTIKSSLLLIFKLLALIVIQRSRRNKEQRF